MMQKQAHLAFAISRLPTKPSSEPSVAYRHRAGGRSASHRLNKLGSGHRPWRSPNWVTRSSCTANRTSTPRRNQRRRMRLQLWKQECEASRPSAMAIGRANGRGRVADLNRATGGFQLKTRRWLMRSRRAESSRWHPSASTSARVSSSKRVRPALMQILPPSPRRA
jgi:hypothetical protein